MGGAVTSSKTGSPVRNNLVLVDDGKGSFKFMSTQEGVWHALAQEFRRGFVGAGGTKSFSAINNLVRRAYGQVQYEDDISISPTMMEDLLEDRSSDASAVSRRAPQKLDLMPLALSLWRGADRKTRHNLTGDDFGIFMRNLSLIVTNLSKNFSNNGEAINPLEVLKTQDAFSATTNRIVKWLSETPMVTSGNNKSGSVLDSLAEAVRGLGIYANGAGGNAFLSGLLAFATNPSNISDYSANRGAVQVLNRARFLNNGARHISSQK